MEKNRLMKVSDSITEMFKQICPNVYYETPPSINMNYPAIRFERVNIIPTFADDGVYLESQVFKVTVMDYDPDSDIFDQVSKIDRCVFDRPYKADGLNHYVFNLYR